jgi:hypothetical protein
MDNINKTIIITEKEGNKLIEFCKEGKSISRDFFDWYLKYNPDLFTENGMLVIDFSRKGKSEAWKDFENQNAIKFSDSIFNLNDFKLAVSFDFSNPNEVIFNSYYYYDQSLICSWVFRRNDNITMEYVSFEIQKIRYHNFFKFTPKSIVEYVEKEIIKILKIKNDKLSKNQRLEMIAQAKKDTFNEVNNHICRTVIYYTYALLYYVSKQEPIEVTADFKKHLEDEIATNKVKYTYKYTGYIDLTKNKIYKPFEDKSDDEPTRDYQRHIEKWHVRGHYRNTKNGRIWIDPHTRGQGELEKRVYGLEDEQNVNIIPKVFEVIKERPIKSDDLPILESIKEAPKSNKITLEPILIQHNYNKKENNREIQQLEPKISVKKKIKKPFLRRLANQFLKFLKIKS